MKANQDFPFDLFYLIFMLTIPIEVWLMELKYIKIGV